MASCSHNWRLTKDSRRGARVGGDVAGGKVEPEKTLDPGPEDLGHHLAMPAGKELVEQHPVVARDPRDRVHQGLGGRRFAVGHRQLAHAPLQQVVAGAEGRGLTRLQFDEIKVPGPVHDGDQPLPRQGQRAQPWVGQDHRALVRGRGSEGVRREGLAPVLAQQRPGRLAQPVGGIGGDGDDTPRLALDDQQDAIRLDAGGQVQVCRVAITKGGIDHRGANYPVPGTIKGAQSSKASGHGHRELMFGIPGRYPKGLG